MVMDLKSHPGWVGEVLVSQMTFELELRICYLNPELSLRAYTLRLITNGFVPKDSVDPAQSFVPACEDARAGILVLARC